ncbi:MAG: Ig-like domain-containing protein [Opitutaceae bacterium]|nr:Ig-like domain-containing protein [Opitutaceae bacterium]
MRSRLRTALAVLFLGAGFTARAEYAIRWIHERAAAIEVDGLTRDNLAQLAAAKPRDLASSELLTVHVEQPVERGSTAPTMPSVAGTWKIVGDALRFEPRFPFAPGVRYRAEFQPVRLPGRPGAHGETSDPSGAARTDPVISYFELPRAPATGATAVVQVFPSGDVLPENQLKFYVHFSAPMSRGGIYEHVQLRDRAGNLIELPFLELDEELWDPAMTRVTLLIDPGRIKRGVKPLEDMGPVFEEGKTYTLAIQPSWRDAGGTPLATTFVKTFRIGPADRTPPDPNRWTIQSEPRTGTAEPLIVGFDEPIDRALALRLIGIARVEPGGRPLSAVEGEVALDDHERRWTFRPVEPWSRGAYRLVVATTIEDLAGNNIGKTFDVELAAGAQRQLATSTISVPFDVK